MDYRKIITTDPRVRNGQPCVRGLPITVSDVLGDLASGMTMDEVLVQRTQLTREDIVACLEFAADRDRRGWFDLCYANDMVNKIAGADAGWQSRFVEKSRIVVSHRLGVAHLCRSI